MAIISAAYSIDMSKLNLNLLYEYSYESGFYDDTDITFNYRNYQDLVWVDWLYGSNYYESVFGGTDITFDLSGNVSGGTVTGYVETYWTNSQYVPVFAIEEINISALSIWAAATTASTTDDYSVFTTAMSGNDQIYGSEYGDVLLGYDGDDTFYAGASNDEIYGGNGIDTYSLKTIESADIAIVKFGGGYNISSAFGLDYLESIEILDLSDGTFEIAQLVPENVTNSAPGYKYDNLTGDNLVDVMTHGYSWNLGSDRTIDFAVANGFASEYWNDPSEVLSHLDTAFGLISYYTDVTFNNLGFFPDPAVAAAYGSEITLSLDGDNRYFPSSSVLGRAFFPNTDLDLASEGYTGIGGDLYLNVESEANYYPSYEPGSQGWFLLLHELGHSLGLKHPHDDGGTGRPTFADLGISKWDDDTTTVMSYQDTTDSLNQIAYDPATPMVLDVLALQYLFGKNNTINSDDTIYDLRDSIGYYLTIWDSGGSDVMDASLTSCGWEIVLPDVVGSNLIDTAAGWCFSIDPTNTVDGNTRVWLTGDIENATGSNFSDRIYGNSDDNIIYGGSGDDILNGGDGNDIIDGGDGDDEISGGDGNDVIYASSGNDVYDGGAGTDTVITDYINSPPTLGGNISLRNIENQFFIGQTNITIDRSLDPESGDNHVKSQTGNDCVLLGVGDDKFELGAGYNFSGGGEGNDTIILEGNGTFGLNAFAINISSNLQTGTGKVLNLNRKTRFEDVTDGGADKDTLELTDSSDAFFLHDSFSGFHSSLTLSNDHKGLAGVARIESIENIYSGEGSDIIDLTSPDYSLAGQKIKISGGNGDDIIWGSDADENIIGDAGKDVLFGGAGTNILTGGAGADDFQFTKTSAKDRIEDFSIDEGDTIKFFNKGGAIFDKTSAALENGNLTIKYGSNVQDQLTVYVGNEDLTISDISDAIIIV